MAGHANNGVAFQTLFLVSRQGISLTGMTPPLWVDPVQVPPKNKCPAQFRHQTTNTHAQLCMHFVLWHNTAETMPGDEHRALLANSTGKTGVVLQNSPRRSKLPEQPDVNVIISTIPVWYGEILTIKRQTVAGGGQGVGLGLGAKWTVWSVHHCRIVTSAGGSRTREPRWHWQSLPGNSCNERSAFQHM